MNKNINYLILLTLVIFLFGIGKIYGFYYNKDYNKRISYVELITIKNYVMDNIELNEDEINHLDQNGDKKIDSSDFVILKNKINK